MKFDELDARMRKFETETDHCVSPEKWMVARLDGRGFTKLTKETLDLVKPFDVAFRNVMMDVTSFLMRSSGIDFSYGFTQSDEISLLFYYHSNVFNRKARKLNSILAGLASARLTMIIQTIGCFDCRISELPTEQDVVDYFRWRQADSVRNALNSHCYWAYRNKGMSATMASKRLAKKTIKEKKDILLEMTSLKFDEDPNIPALCVPAWQKTGAGYYYKSVQIEGFNPLTQKSIPSSRREMTCDMNLPSGLEYDAYLRTRIEEGKKTCLV